MKLITETLTFTGREAAAVEYGEALRQCAEAHREFRHPAIVRMPRCIDGPDQDDWLWIFQITWQMEDHLSAQQAAAVLHGNVRLMLADSDYYFHTGRIDMTRKMLGAVEVDTTL